MSEKTNKASSKKSTVKKKVAVSKKAVVKKKAVAKKSASTRARKKAAITASQRRQMIAEAAYYIAEKRDFLGGDVYNDWLEAEREIDRQYQVSD